MERALVWAGTAAGVVELRGPDPERQTRALAVADGVVVGEYGRNWTLRAAMWHGSPAAMTELHPVPPPGYPPDAQVSSACGVGDGQQVGVVWWKKTAFAEPVARAALWTGSAASFVDLTPRPFRNASAQACAGGLQVGWATRLATTDWLRAILWSGSAEDYVDLQELLPPPWNRSSAADIQVDGATLRIVGTVGHLVKQDRFEVVQAESVAVWEATLGGSGAAGTEVRMPDAKGRARPPASPKRLLKLLSALRPPGGRDKGLPDTLTGAASRGDLELVRVFLERGASLEERTVGFASPLAAAAAAGHAEVVAFLLARGAKLRPEQAVISPVHAALQNGHAAVVQLLLAAGATVSDMERAFVNTCQNARYSMIKRMLDAGLDIDRPGGGYEGETIRKHAIRAAQMSNHPRIAAYLRGKPVAEAALVAAEARAVKEDRALAVGIMRERGEEPVATGDERVAKLAEAEAIVRAAGPKCVRWTDESGEPVLSVAARNAVVGVVTALLEAGADPSAAAPDSGLTPLIRAAQGGSPEIVRRLLERGADANAQASGGFTALQAAAEFGDPEVVRLLVEAGADPAVKGPEERKAAARIRGPYAAEIEALLGRGPGGPAGRDRRGAPPALDGCRRAQDDAPIV